MNSPLFVLFSDPLAGIIFLFSIIVAITVHEFAHAWAAYQLGDDTPYLAGRVTLNPLAHLDPFGSIMFLLVGFGYGKPVMYNPMRLKTRFDELLIALAGPASNIMLAMLGNLIGTIQDHTGTTLIQPDILGIFILINLSLAAFNMIPIPPLDGSSIIAYFWPSYRSLVGGQIGLILILILILVPGLLIGIVTPVITAFGDLSTLFGLLHNIPALTGYW